MRDASLSIGIVGAGIAGCSAAYFLRKEFPANTQITIYESESRIGGRIQTTYFAGTQVELGATFIHSSNRMLIHLTEAVSLKQSPLYSNAITPGTQRTVGIWNGADFVIQIPSSGAKAFVKLAIRYGLPLVRLAKLMREVLARWERIYELLAADQIFLNVQEMMSALRLLSFTQISTDVLLSTHNISAKLSDELSGSIINAIYNQDRGINSFAGSLAHIAAGLAGGTSSAVQGGNDQLCNKLLAFASATVRMPNRISSIRTGSEGRIVLSDESGQSDTFDAVIIAAPLQSSRISLDNVWTKHLRFIPNASQGVTVTFVEGQLSPASFHLPSTARIPDQILSPSTDDSSFSVISLVGRSPVSMLPVYKLSSRLPLSDQTLRHMFYRMNDCMSLKWNAYPQMVTTTIETPFKLDKGLYYINSMEPVASTLETEVVASKNVIGIMKRDYLLSG
jgi:prenylcysteine oxidase / farnesylcysteine lyase